MTHEGWVQLFADVVIFGIVILLLIDVAAELKITFAIRMKWSIFWYLLRYICQGCAIALALTVLARG